MKKLISLLILIGLTVTLFSACKKEETLSADPTDHVHEFGDWTVKKPATCFEEGEKERTCACGEKETEVLPTTDHVYENGACIHCGKKKPSEGLSFTEKNGFYEVSGVGNCTDADIVIPDEYEGKPVSSVASEAFINIFDNFFSVYIPDSVKTIGKGAFFGCESLKTVVLPKNLLKVEESVFEGCIALESINFPDGLTTIEARAFYGCSSLSDFKLPPALLTVGDKAFSSCYGIVDLVIPDNVKEIGVQAFAFCSSMATVIFPESLEKLGEMSFMISGTSMKSFFYKGSKKQWGNIDKGSKWNYLTSDCPVVYDYVAPEEAVE